MRRFWCSMFTLMLLVVMVGCASTGGTPTTQAAAQAKLDQAEFQMQLGSGVATTVVLLSLDEKDRAEFGKFAYVTAEAINRVAKDETLKLSGVRDVATDMIRKSGYKHKEAVGYLLSAISDLIEAKLQDPAFKDATSKEKLQMARALLRGASTGVMQSTSIYRPSVSALDTMREKDILYCWLRPTERLWYG